MIALIDTNVIVDVFIRREPHYKFSQMVLLAIEEGLVIGYVSASAITDIFYIVSKHFKSKTNAKNQLKNHLLNYMNIAYVDGEMIKNALNIEWDDFEDALQYCVGESIAVDYIITRNQKDFSKGIISVLSPEELIDIVSQ